MAGIAVLRLKSSYILARRGRGWSPRHSDLKRHAV